MIVIIVLAAAVFGASILVVADEARRVLWLRKTRHTPPRGHPVGRNPAPHGGRARDSRTVKSLQEREPARGLIFAEPVPADRGGGLLLGCDCGAVTHLVIDGPITASQEFAVTCNRCLTPWWVTIRAGAAAGTWTA